MNWQDFLNMGGYGLYVWGSYGVTFALLAAELFLLGARRKALRKQTARNRVTNRGAMNEAKT